MLPDGALAIRQATTTERIPALGTPLIAFENVSKRFGAVPAVADVSLAIAAGEFFCLLGPSGCGKSTLLRLLAGFERPDAGRILLDGRDISRDPPHRRPLNMMFQSYALFPHLTVAGNVAYGLRWLPLGRRERAERVAAMLRLVRLEDVGARYPSEISGGQGQRVALARALARRPRVLLLDEPLGALDRRLREDTQAELKALRTNLGTTFIMVTHDQSEAMSLADRIGVMAGGRLAQVGTPEEVYRDPADRFVAGFLGDVNIFEGRVLGREAGLVSVATPDADRPLLVSAGRQATAAGTPVAVAVRPEAIRLGPAGQEADGPNRLSGILLDRSFLGSATAYRVGLTSGQVVRVTLAREADGGSGLGSRVSLSFPASAGTVVA